MAEHTYQFLVSISTEKELQPEDIALALTGTGNACADPRYDRLTVAWAAPEEAPKVAPPLSRYVSYLCAACGHTHGFGEPCLAGAG